MEESDQSKIEKLKKSLYSRKGVSRSAHILDLNKHEDSIEEKWSDPSPKNILEKEHFDFKDKEENSPMLNKILVSSLGFFVVCISIAGFIFFKGGNIISDKKIETNIIGPVMVAAGEEMSLDVNITNNNDAEIELADLILEYPKGTRSAYDKTTELPRDRISVGSIASGETVKKTIKFVPFGEEGEKLSTKMSLEYRIPNSSSVFNKDFSYDFLVGSSPVTLKVSALKEINSNQELSINISLVSNSNEVLKNIVLVGDIPFGFNIKSADPALTSGKPVWRLGDIEPQGKRTIKISGIVIGEANQNRVFKFSAGTETSKKFGELDATFATVSHEVSIKKPFLGAQIFVDKSPAEYVGVSNAGYNLSIEYQNNLSVPVNDLVIEARIKGDIVDRRTISLEGGFYKSSEDLLRWSKFEKEDLAVLVPGDDSSLPFHFKAIDGYSPLGLKMRNPSISIDVTVKGKRLSESNVPEEIVSTVSRTIKVATDLRLSGRTVHSVGSIENEGNIPPQVGKKTDYTIIWTVTNNFNDTENTKVTATLPSFISWTGVSTPSSEKITYNSDSRQVTWDLGKVNAPSVGNSFRQVAFQVSLIPSLSQLGDSPVLVNASTLSGKDVFTGTIVSDTIREMTTVLGTDPSYKFGDDRVVE